MTNNISYKTNIVPTSDEIIALYISAGLKRPVEDVDRISKMYSNSNLIISAWVDNELVGIARSVTDFCYCCYLSDLAIKKEFQQQGIGKRLIDKTKEILGDEVMLLLLAAPSAMEYYPKVGLDKVENGFIINRKR